MSNRHFLRGKRIAILDCLLASSSTTQPSPRPVWTRILATIVFFAALEGILFHSGLYSSIVEPVSTTGFMESQIRNEIRRPKPNHNQVLAVGDSRMPLLPRIVNEAGGDYTFATMALGGTSPRTWYYALRAVDPHANNYAAIVIPSADYNEPDYFDYQSEREVDLHYLIGRLGLRDLGEFPWTYRGKKAQWMIVRGMILKGTIYKRDFIEFLDHPIDRIVKAQYYNHDSAGWYYVYGGATRISLDCRSTGSTKRSRLPSGLQPASAIKSRACCFQRRSPARDGKLLICAIGMDGSWIITEARARN